MKTVKPISLSLLVCALALIGFTLARETASGSHGADGWEYQIVDTADLVIDSRLTDMEIQEAAKRGIQKARSLEGKLNSLGSNGWELAVCTSSMYIFKRPTQ
jgi:hypothetical protein